MALLEIENLVVEFQTSTGPFRAVDVVSLKVDAGEVLGVFDLRHLRRSLVQLSARRSVVAAIDERRDLVDGLIDRDAIAL